MKKLLATFALYLLSTVASAQVFQYYGPAAGIQKNTGSTYQNTSAVSSDIAGLWIGTNCGTSTNVPLLNGNCAVPGVTGAAGSTGNVQYNNAGAFAATGDFTWDPTNLILTLGNTGVGGPIITTPGPTATLGLQVLIQGGASTSGGTGGPVVVEGGTGTNNIGGTVTLLGGPGTSTQAGGAAQIQGGHAANATGGAIALTTFAGSTSGNASGQLSGTTSNALGSGNSGLISFQTGSVSAGTAGNISLTTGASTGGGTSGSVAITASHNAGGTDGSITLAAHGATVETIGAGVQIGAPTGGDCGAGCLNAQALRVNNTAVVTGAGGSTTQLQYNNGGVFGGASNVTYSSGTGGLTIAAPTSGPAITSTGVATSYAGKFIGSSTTGQSLGVLIQGGTNSSDAGFAVQNQSGGSTFFETFGDGHGTLGPSATLGLSWATTGDVTIPAPSSGNALSITAASGANALSVTGSANSYGEHIFSSSTSGQSLGLVLDGGTTSADGPLLVRNQAGSVTYAQIFGDGHGTLGPSASLGLSWNTTGDVTIPAPSSGTALTVNGVANTNTFNLQGSSTTGQSLGIQSLAGTNSSDFAFRFYNFNGVSQILLGYGDGGVITGNPTGGDKGAGTFNTAGTIYTNNVPQRVASISATCTSGGCTAVVANGVSTSITRSGTGTYAVTFSPNFGSAPVCVPGSYLGSSAAYGSTISVAPTTSGTTVATFSGASAADENFSLICNGT